MLVLDASGSMLEEDGGQGATRMAVAQQAVTDLIAAAPDGAQLGVMVYGSTVGNTEAEKEAGCQDIVTLADVGPVDREALTTEVNAISASGWTPIGTSLEQAADALPEGGSIVLVSDGIDTCAPPEPCEVAESLTGAGIDLTVHTVGFRVDEAAAQQLQCIAETTGGTYADADDAGQLTEEMSVQVQRALRSYVPAGQPIEGSAQPADAVEVAAGDYVMQLSSTDGATPQQAIQHVRVPLREGEILHAAATVVRPQRPGGSSTDYAAITISQVAESRCTYDHDQNNAGNPLGGPPTAVLVTAPAAAGDECFPGGYAVLAVERSGMAAADVDLPVELSLQIQEPVDPATVESAPEADIALPEISEHEVAEAQPVTPGLNYSTATPLEAGGNYTARATSGEFHVYTVHLEPGQRLAAAVRPTSGLDDNAAVQLNIAAPDRTALSMTESVSGYRRGSFAFQLKNGQVHADRMLATVNPAASDPPNLAGDYYLMVSVENPQSQDTVVPYTLRVETAGEPAPSPTVLSDPEPLTAAGQAEQAAQESGEQDLAGDPAAPSEEARGTTAGETGAGEEAGSDAATAGGQAALVWSLAGGGLLLVIVGGWLLATRRRT